ncbi:MAG: hypothetical protein ABS69_17230 [Nitrosomonadales bacterium SCN 54-20]|nr:MAG: hypothetical protein ABS69_17230 [Nitrosomonadales bacterium SCN 54-20]
MDCEVAQLQLKGKIGDLRLEANSDKRAELEGDRRGLMWSSPDFILQLPDLRGCDVSDQIQLFSAVILSFHTFFLSINACMGVRPQHIALMGYGHDCSDAASRPDRSAVPQLSDYFSAKRHLVEPLQNGFADSLAVITLSAMIVSICGSLVTSSGAAMRSLTCSR